MVQHDLIWLQRYRLKMMFANYWEGKCATATKHHSQLSKA